MAKYFTKEQDRQWRTEQPKKLIAAKVIVKSSNGNVLLVKPTYKPTWQLPGGVVEAGENPVTAAVREMSEEIGVVWSEADLKLVDMVFRPEQDILLVLYELAKPQGEALQIKVQDAELETYEWVAPNEVAARLPEYYSEFWQQYSE
jgi:8-oxo-dGTP diphosphatase